MTRAQQSERNSFLPSLSQGSKGSRDTVHAIINTLVKL